MWGFTDFDLCDFVLHNLKVSVEKIIICCSSRSLQNGEQKWTAQFTSVLCNSRMQPLPPNKLDWQTLIHRAGWTEKPQMNHKQPCCVAPWLIHCSPTIPIVLSASYMCVYANLFKTWLRFNCLDTAHTANAGSVYCKTDVHSYFSTSQWEFHWSSTFFCNNLNI